MQSFLWEIITFDLSDQIKFKEKEIECQTCAIQGKNIRGS